MIIPGCARFVRSIDRPSQSSPAGTAIVTGFAGPSGGTQVLPVGSIYLGYSSPVGVWAKKLNLRGDRASNRRRAATGALDWMRRKLRKYKLEEVFAAADSDSFDI